MHDHIARTAAFATLGALTTAQDLIRRFLSATENAHPDLVAEETLCLVAVASARAAEVGLREHPDAARTLAHTLYDLPLLYRDFVVGSAVLEQDDPSLAEEAEAALPALDRKREFYGLHLPTGQMPGEALLREKLPLWLGRISPPSLPMTPDERLEPLGVLPPLLTHLRLVLAFARHVA